MNKGLAGLLIILLLGVGAFATSQSSKAAAYEKKVKTLEQKSQKLERENKSISKELQAKERNNEETVKKDATAFLQAFYVYDTGKGEFAWTKIKPYATEKVQQMLTPSGPPDQMGTKVTQAVYSGIDKSLLYYTAVDATYANVFARIWQKLTTNGVSSVTQIPVEMQLIYDEKQKKWLVDDFKMQQPLREDGYIN